MPQFDLMCFQVLLSSTLLVFLLFYRINIVTLIPTFADSSKTRYKKIQLNKNVTEAVHTTSLIGHSFLLHRYLSQ